MAGGGRGVSGRQRGFTLLEVLVAMVVGVTVIAALIAVLQRSRHDFTTSQSLASLQDSARHALTVIASDIEHAGFYGFGGARVQLVRGGTAGTVLAEDAALFQPGVELSVPAVGGLPAGAHDCGINFAVDLFTRVQAADGHYELGRETSDCAPTGSAGGAAPGADTLTLRYASLTTTAPRAGRLQVYSAARSHNGPLQLFADGLAPGPIDASHEVRDVEVRSYYIANDSVARRGWPALRVKALTESRGAAQYRDEEVMPGVEDLQVEFLVSRLEDGVEQLRHVLPDARQSGERIVAVRIWLRVRADLTESGFRDERALSYAGVRFTPSAHEARQRRLVIERTVAVRNART
jgi:type IV pilus assembly protein PilW